MDVRLKSAMDDIDSLMQANAGLCIDSDYLPAFPGGTNTVIFGHYNENPIVFKHYRNIARKQHEEYVLQLFAETGYVPKVFPVESDTLLVMQRFRGLPFFMVEDAVDSTQWKGLFRQLGAALAQIVEAKPGGADAISSPEHTVSGPGFDYRFYCDANIETFFDIVTERSMKALAEQDVPHKDILQKSLSAIRANREALLSFPSFVCMDDFHYSNMIADGPILQGFIDLEMARYGNEILVLAAVLASMVPNQPKRWTWLRKGYEDEQGHALDSEMISLSVLFAPFSQWVRFMWYWSTDDLPQWAVKSNMRASVVQDIKEIIELSQRMELQEP